MLAIIVHMTFIFFHFKAFETKKKQTEEVKLIPEGRNAIFLNYINQGYIMCPHMDIHQI
jgi:hypothetical protein